MPAQICAGFPQQYRTEYHASGANPTTIKANCSTSLYIVARKPPSRIYVSTNTAAITVDSKKLHPKMTCRISAIAYSPTPDTNTVSTANESALKTRVGSPKRTFRNSGTLRTLLR